MTRKRQAQRCTAHRSNGTQCEAWAMNGCTVCRVHGGTAPQVRKAANSRVVEAGAAALLARHGVTSVENPLAELAMLAGEVLATKNAARELLAALGEGEWRYRDAKGGEQLRAEVALYERSLDRSVRVLVDMCRLNVDQRLMAVSEAQGAILAGVIRAVLGRLDLGEQAGRVPALMAEELRKVASGGPADESGF